MKFKPNSFDVGFAIKAGGKVFRLIKRKEEFDTDKGKAYLVSQIKPAVYNKWFVKKFKYEHEYEKVNKLSLSELEMKERGII